MVKNLRLNAENQAETKLASAIGTSDTVITVDDSTVLPPVPHRLTIYDSTSDEIVEVTAVDTTTDEITVERGKEDTIAQTWDSGSSIENRFTRGTYNEMLGLEDRKKYEDTIVGGYDQLGNRGYPVLSWEKTQESVTEDWKVFYKPAYDPHDNLQHKESYITRKTVSVTSNYTASDRDIVIADGAITITLPTPSSEAFVDVKNVSTSDVTVDGNGNNIDGSASYTISTQYENISLVSDGTEWWTL